MSEESIAPPGSPPSPGEAPRTLGALTARVRPRVVAASVLAAVAGLASLVPFVAVYMLAKALTAAEPDRGEVWVVVAVTVASVVVQFVCHGAAVSLSHTADMEMQLLLRRSMAARLARAPLGWISERGAGRLKNTLQDDVEDMHYLVAHALPDFVVAVSTPLAATVYLAFVDWRLTLICLVGIPCYLVGHRVMARVAGSRMGAIGTAMGKLNSAVVEFVQGISVVKAFGQTKRAHSRFARAADDYLEAFSTANRPLLRIQSLSTGLLSPAATLLVVILAGTLFVSQGWLPAVDVVPFVTLGLGLTAPVLVVGLAGNSLRSARAAAERVGDLLSVPPLPEPEAPRTPADNRVELRRVTFGYEPDAPVLHEVGAVLEAGTVTALVGPSGAGKSTLATLLPRFADPQSGQVLLGGVDVRDIASDELYRHVGFVLQDARFLRTSIADNLRLARPAATDTELAEAIRAVALDERIAGLPRGHDSVIGEDAQFSGGEAQRLSIARALLADTPVLVLDEATAYADPESEAAVQRALSRLIAGRTVLVIAHRLSSIVDADNILVLDEGRVVEQGGHAALLASDGLYAAMWRTHQRHTESADGRVRAVGSPAAGHGHAQIGATP
ncbi:ABC transporter ATP-binding protein [Streptomyces triticagri]|uniref:ABC transporter ATP-binding protein n=1 Tax=Streptomyces triticagri TaxID=2293568 RepID=A0A372M0N9_9ACTN|nr:ABC transporter ATP-binding protein [Streptomyces triticagri]RFU84389.1 ABC transporter ATP-binding protein [Streptomyces triticagri]